MAICCKCHQPVNDEKDSVREYIRRHMVDADKIMQLAGHEAGADMHMSKCVEHKDVLDRLINQQVQLQIVLRPLVAADLGLTTDQPTTAADQQTLIDQLARDTLDDAA